MQNVMGKIQWIGNLSAVAAGFCLVRYSWANGADRADIPVLAFVLGAFAGVLWLVVKIYGGNRHKKAMRLAAQGQHQEALGLLMQAEETWTLNFMHETRKTIAKDFQRLGVIVSAIQEQVDALGGALESEKLLQVITVITDIHSNRKNFTLLNSNMKSEAKATMESLNSEFPALRGQFRASCQAFYQGLEGSG